jgi:hypothetical protein
METIFDTCEPRPVKSSRLSKTSTANWEKSPSLTAHLGLSIATIFDFLQEKSDINLDNRDEPWYDIVAAAARGTHTARPEYTTACLVPTSMGVGRHCAAHVSARVCPGRERRSCPARKSSAQPGRADPASGERAGSSALDPPGPQRQEKFDLGGETGEFPENEIPNFKNEIPKFKSGILKFWNGILKFWNETRYESCCCS